MGLSVNSHLLTQLIRITIVHENLICWDSTTAASTNLELIREKRSAKGLWAWLSVKNKVISKCAKMKLPLGAKTANRPPRLHPDQQGTRCTGENAKFQTRSRWVNLRYLKSKERNKTLYLLREFKPIVDHWDFSDNWHYFLTNITNFHYCKTFSL